MFNYKEWAARPDIKKRRAALKRARLKANPVIRARLVRENREYRKLPGKVDRANELRRRHYAANSEYKEKKKVAARNTYHSNGQSYRLRSHYKIKFGITLEEKAAMLAAQGGVCKICGTDDPGTERDWHTDHIHGTKVIRGILCHDCNVKAGDGSYAALYKARRIVEYLEPWCEAD